MQASHLFCEDIRRQARSGQVDGATRRRASCPGSALQLTLLLGMLPLLHAKALLHTGPSIRNAPLPAQDMSAEPQRRQLDKPAVQAVLGSPGWAPITRLFTWPCPRLRSTPFRHPCRPGVQVKRSVGVRVQLWPRQRPPTFSKVVQLSWKTQSKPAGDAIDSAFVDSGVQSPRWH